MAQGPSGGPLGVFAAIDFFVYVCDPFDKKWGSWGPAPAVGANFSKTCFWGHLGLNEALAAPDDPLAQNLFLECVHHWSAHLCTNFCLDTFIHG